MAVLQRADENRSSPRLETRAVLTYFPFSTRKVPAIDTRACNCSPEGIAFQSARPIKPGQTICLIRKAAPEESRTAHGAGALLKSFVLAEVRWCLKVSDDEEGYRVGAKYF